MWRKKQLVQVPMWLWVFVQANHFQLLVLVRKSTDVRVSVLSLFTGWPFSVISPCSKKCSRQKWLSPWGFDLVFSRVFFSKKSQKIFSKTQQDTFINPYKNYLQLFAQNYLKKLQQFCNDTRRHKKTKAYELRRESISPFWPRKDTLRLVVIPYVKIGRILFVTWQKIAIWKHCVRILKKDLHAVHGIVGFQKSGVRIQTALFLFFLFLLIFIFHKRYQLQNSRFNSYGLLTETFGRSFLTFCYHIPPRIVTGKHED
jgi:hypothetical protein